MTILTDELIEKAKKAYGRAMNKGPGATHSTCLRAALKAALPDIIEACAKVAETHCVRPETNIYAEWYQHGQNIALSIRSLSPKQKD